MKKIFYTIPCLLILIFTQSCQKNKDTAGSKQVVIDTTLSAGTEYQLNLQPYGDRDDIAAIRKQATHFTTSKIIDSPGTFAPVYHYISNATAKVAVTDQVVLAVTEGNTNNYRHRGDSTIITINFSVQ